MLSFINNYLAINIFMQGTAWRVEASPDRIMELKHKSAQVMNMRTAEERAMYRFLTLSLTGFFRR
jgi:hypothetical protein